MSLTFHVAQTYILMHMYDMIYLGPALHLIEHFHANLIIIIIYILVTLYN